MQNPTLHTLTAETIGTVAPRCLNCGAERLGEYCHACGQHHLEGRLTLGTVAREFAERFLSLERGLLRTFRELCTDPGGVARRYVDGQRRRYVSPFTYLLISVAILLLGYELVDPQMRAWMEATLGESVRDMSAGLREGSEGLLAGFTPEQGRRFTETMIQLSKQTTFTSLAMALPFVLLARLFFRRTGVNMAEATAFTLFCFGHAYLLATLVSIPLIYAGFDVGTVTQASSLFYLVFPAYAALGFFGRRVGTAVKALLAMILAYLVFAAVLWTGVAVYVLRTA